ncbi:hypothetical protein K0A11_21335 [Salmonella enterica subsp. enterica serovar Mbandaka]|nr:hypothetical protein [Salmonella enterica subsp. enterica serovar Mbandaka]MCR3282423.1 hypothetical protein [Salmonella enterica subsp. enterica serovar Mbandaka]MCR3316831.1 hypothetical protein [Salmonella enterica subsp. enterica serovar Mbandaka]
MATLKDHQQAMVDLLASGSGIPASASRLAHAMHDVLSAMLGDKKESFAEEMTRLCNEHIEATTPGLNDKALAADVEVCRPKQEIKESMLRAKERRIKELENTVRQLRASNAKLRGKETDVLGEVHKWSIDRCLVGRTNYTDIQNMIIDAYVGLEPEQAGCRKPDTQVDCSQCQHDYVYRETINARRCLHCGDVQK